MFTIIQCFMINTLSKAIYLIKSVQLQTLMNVKVGICANGAYCINLNWQFHECPQVQLQQPAAGLKGNLKQ